MKNRTFSERLTFALSGLREGWHRERSFRTQVGCGILAILALIVLRLGAQWWAIVSVVIAMVLAHELINGAMEMLMDHLHPDVHPKIRVVKDMAAASVLLLSIAALAVAAFMVIATLM
jgi:undecaprenol kinase